MTRLLDSTWHQHSQECRRSQPRNMLRRPHTCMSRFCAEDGSGCGTGPAPLPLCSLGDISADVQVALRSGASA